MTRGSIAVNVLRPPRMTAKANFGTLLKKCQSTSSTHGNEIPTAVQQVRFAVEGMGTTCDDIVVDQVIFFPGPRSLKTGRQPIPIGIWRTGLFQHLSTPVDTDSRVAKLHPIRNPPPISSLPTTMDMDNAGHGRIRRGSNRVTLVGSNQG